MKRTDTPNLKLVPAIKNLSTIIKATQGIDTHTQNPSFDIGNFTNTSNVVPGDSGLKNHESLQETILSNFSQTQRFDCKNSEQRDYSFPLKNFGSE